MKQKKIIMWSKIILSADYIILGLRCRSHFLRVKQSKPMGRVWEYQHSARTQSLSFWPWERSDLVKAVFFSSAIWPLAFRSMNPGYRRNDMQTTDNEYYFMLLERKKHQGSDVRQNQTLCWLFPIFIYCVCKNAWTPSLFFLAFFNQVSYYLLLIFHGAKCTQILRAQSKVQGGRLNFPS